MPSSNNPQPVQPIHRLRCMRNRDAASSDVFSQRPRSANRAIVASTPQNLPSPSHAKDSQTRPCRCSRASLYIVSILAWCVVTSARSSALVSSLTSVGATAVRDLGLTCTCSAMPCVCRTMICHRFARTGGRSQGLLGFRGRPLRALHHALSRLALRTLDQAWAVPTVSAAEDTFASDDKQQNSHRVRSHRGPLV